MEEIEGYPRIPIGKAKDLTGMKFGKTAVLYRTEHPQNVKANDTGAWWLCRCDMCGEYFVSARNVQKHTWGCQKCSCVQANIKHGLTDDPMYAEWSRIVNRTTNPKAREWSRYGGRGIVMSDEFRQHPEKFIEYVKSLSNYGIDGFTLNRINNDGNYERGNLEWADYITQNNNRDCVLWVEHPVTGEKVPAHTIGKELGLNYYGINCRLNKLGWNVEKAVTTPAKRAKLYECDGERHTLTEWSVITGIPKTTLRRRLDEYGWAIGKALTEPLKEWAPKKNIPEYSFNGEKHNLVEWGRIGNIPYTTLHSRMSRGWSFEKAITTPLQNHKVPKSL